MARIIYYNDTNTCQRVKEDGNICGNKLEPGSTYREKDKNGHFTGRWVCRTCWGKDYQQNDPNSQHNIIKKLAGRRTRNISPNCSSAKGDLFEELTCRWRGVKNLNIENDNYGSPMDHSKDPELGIIQTKGSFFHIIYNQHEGWKFNVEREHNKEFDNMISYCVSKDRKRIEGIYILPKKDVIKRISTIVIVRNPSRSVWYEKYRVKDENILNKVNEIWKKLMEC